MTVKSKKKVTKKPKKTIPYELDSFTVMDDCKVYRRRDGGEQYWVKIYSPTDKKYVRRSLRTKNKENSIIECKKLYKEIIQRTGSGEKIITTTVSNLTKKFIEFQTLQTQKGRLSKGRLKCIKLFLNTIVDFLGKTTRVGGIPRNKFHDQYEEYREKRSVKDITDGTIWSELQVWKQMVKWGIRQNMVSSTIFLNYPILNVVKNRRDTFTDEEYRKIYRTLNSKSYLNHKNTYISSRRSFIKYVFLILCNTGMRTGELRQSKWKHIGEPYEYEDEHTGEIKETVEIYIPPENSKNRKKRQVIGFGNTKEFLEKVKELSEYTKPNDFIFTTSRGDEWVLSDRTFDSLMKECGVDKTDRKLAWYSCRHFYGTKRIGEGVPLFFLKDQMGTSLEMMDKHYGHLTIKSHTSQINQVKRKSNKTKKGLSPKEQ
mgnify:FL=1